MKAYALLESEALVNKIVEYENQDDLMDQMDVDENLLGLLGEKDSLV